MMNGLGIPKDALINRKLTDATTRKGKMELLWKAILGRLPKKTESHFLRTLRMMSYGHCSTPMNLDLGGNNMDRRDFIYSVGMSGAAFPFLRNRCHGSGTEGEVRNLHISSGGWSQYDGFNVEVNTSVGETRPSSKVTQMVFG